jgi:hypothetical protein
MTLFRALSAFMLLVLPALAGPPLTTIQDVLYKAGTPFNGILNISWTSFQAADNSEIATQVTTVKVFNGNVRVQLVPNVNSNPPGYYSVVYNSDGHVQFSETWAVPAAAQPLRIREVRVATSNTAGGNIMGGGGTLGQESDIVGLVADLAARPLKGSGFSAGRVAMINGLGALDAVVGNAGDCVRVDGSTGSCGPRKPPSSMVIFLQGSWMAPTRDLLFPLPPARHRALPFTATACSRRPARTTRW